MTAPSPNANGRLNGQGGEIRSVAKKTCESMEADPRETTAIRRQMETGREPL